MTNAEVRFNKSLRPRKPEGSLGRTAQDVHLDSHTAPELCLWFLLMHKSLLYLGRMFDFFDQICSGIWSTDDGLKIKEQTSSSSLSLRQFHLRGTDG